MKRVSRILTLGALAVVAMALPSPAGAACSSGQPLMHFFDNFFAGCPDANPVDAYAYVLGQENINTATGAVNAGADGKLDIACEAFGVQTEQGLDCQLNSGTAGDGQVSILMDWGGINWQVGNATCPNPAGAYGFARNVVEVVANDGSSAIVTVGFEQGSQVYVLESAHPGGGTEPIFCSQTNGLTLVSNTPGVQANTVCVQQAAPPIHSDCDLGSGGEFTLTCQGPNTGTPLVAAPGNLFSLTGACNATPDLRRSLWTPLPTVAGPGGSKCASVAVPPPLPAGQCAFIGSSSLFSDGFVTNPSESPALTGWMRIAGNVAASDKVAIKKAELLQGKLRVDFGTENEAAIVGFNVYAGSSKLNSGIIQAKGIGSNDYSFEVGRGALKNERSITVEAVKSDGTTVRSSSVSVK